MTATYLEFLDNPPDFSRIVEVVGEKMSKDFKNQEFEALAVTGLSGIVLGSVISFKYNIPLIVIRKDSENTHSFCRIEGNHLVKKVAFLDDFISTGDTFKRVLQELKVYEIEVANIYLYFQNGLYLSEKGAFLDMAADKEIICFNLWRNSNG